MKEFQEFSFPSKKIKVAELIHELRDSMEPKNSLLC
jgi:hypothetical protein